MKKFHGLDFDDKRRHFNEIEHQEVSLTMGPGCGHGRARARIRLVLLLPEFLDKMGGYGRGRYPGTIRLHILQHLQELCVSGAFSCDATGQNEIL